MKKLLHVLMLDTITADAQSSCLRIRNADKSKLAAHTIDEDHRIVCVKTDIVHTETNRLL